MSYIIAHRANGTGYPENSLNAILKSLSSPEVDGIELDVRLTKDNQFILSHSEFILGKNKKIRKISSTYLKQIKKEKDLFSLEEILKKIKTNKYIFLDLKTSKRKYLYRIKLMKLLKKYPNHYYLCSFDYSFLMTLKRKYPSYKVGLMKSILWNQKKEKGILDFVLTYYKIYNGEEGIWTVNKKEIVKKYDSKVKFIITDNPKIN